MASRSVSLEALFGMPHGSVLGPILFLFYVADLLQLLKRHGLHLHCYADNTQVYGFSDVDALQERLSICTDEVFSWVMSNRLQFNPAKTEVLWCSSARCQHQISADSVRDGDTSVLLVRTIRDLGSTLTQMSAHVTAIVRACFAAFRQIRSVCRDMYHLVDTSSRSCGHKGGLLQLSSLGHFRTTVTTAAVCLKCHYSSRVLVEEVRARNSTPP